MITNGRAGGVYRRRSPPPATEVWGYDPRKVLEILYANGVIWSKIALCFDSKLSAILIQIFGHKWFSHVA